MRERVVVSNCYRPEAYWRVWCTCGFEQDVPEIETAFFDAAKVAGVHVASLHSIDGCVFEVFEAAFEPSLFDELEALS